MCKFIDCILYKFGYTSNRKIKDEQEKLHSLVKKLITENDNMAVNISEDEIFVDSSESKFTINELCLLGFKNIHLH